jgi:hypothetical protein
MQNIVRNLIYLIGFLVFASCQSDDDSSPTEQIDIPDPNEELIVLDGLTRLAMDGSTIFDQSFTYQNGIYWSQASTQQGSRVAFTANFSDNFQVEEITSSSGVQYAVDYSPRTVILESVQNNLIQRKTLILDTNNMVEEILMEEENPSTGAITDVSRRLLNYNANFNLVSTVDVTTGFSPQTLRRELYQYDFVNNPFRNMNGVLSQQFYLDFVPMSRFFPSGVVIEELENGNLEVMQTIVYDYTLNEDGFPLSRQVEIRDRFGGLTDEYQEVFSLATVQR